MRIGQRIEELIAQLDLSVDQKEKIQDIIAQGKKDFRDALPTLRDATPQERQQKIQEIIEGMRMEIGDILTPDQKEKLQDLIAKEREQNGQRMGNEEQPNKPAANALRPRTFAMPATRPALAIAPNPKPQTFSPGSGDIGKPAPDVALHWIGGEPMKISDYKKTTVVLIFGSYTDPTFRDKAPQLSALANRYSGRAKFVLIYTKEAHPSDGWDVERNKKENIDIAQTTDLTARKQAAQQAQTALHLENIPIALDTTDDTAITAYNAFPEGVVIISKTGKIAARQHWLDPSGLPELIDGVLEK